MNKYYGSTDQIRIHDHPDIFRIFDGWKVEKERTNGHLDESEKDQSESPGLQKLCIFVFFFA